MYAISQSKFGGPEVLELVDVVFDLVGKGYAQRSFKVLKPGGMIVTAVERTSQELPVLARDAGVRFEGITVEPDYVGLERLTELIENGKVKPHVEHIVPLLEIARAHELVASGSTMGKVSVSIP